MRPAEPMGGVRIYRPMWDRWFSSKASWEEKPKWFLGRTFHCGAGHVVDALLRLTV